MRAINLYTFTRIQDDYATEYGNLLPCREKKEKVRSHEFDTLKDLVNLFLVNDGAISKLDGFFFSFKIEQIGKEFDLLKIDRNNLVLNIELKSRQVEEEKIKKQLKQNQYYLRHIADRIKLFTFVSETGKIYEYVDDRLVESSMKEMAQAMGMFEEFVSAGIEALFGANVYLISPINAPEEFLNGQYFLTNQQEDIKKRILKVMGAGEGTVLRGVTGKAGTGKTLLIYDIIRTMAGPENRCCIVHCGIPGEGHDYLKSHWDNVDIIVPGDIDRNPDILAGFHSIFVDEAQRIHNNTFEKIIADCRTHEKAVVWCYDVNQIPSHSEGERDLSERLKELPEFEEYMLSDKIRTSKEISAFCRTLFDLRDVPGGHYDYSDIDVLFAHSTEEAGKLIDLYEEKGYVYISYTQTGRVIGQEFDQVIISMDDNFRFDEEGVLRGLAPGDPGNMFPRMLYQGVTRAREKLCILVVNNYILFEEISNIKYQMLERFQYRENKRFTDLAINRLDVMIHDIREEFEADGERAPKEAWTIVNAMIMLKEELLEPDPRRKVVYSGVALLELLADRDLGMPGIREFLDYVLQAGIVGEDNVRISQWLGMEKWQNQDLQ